MQQTVDMLHKKLEQLGAVKQGSFCVDCETYHATGTVSGNIHSASLLSNFLDIVLDVNTLHSQTHLSVTGQPSKLLYVMHNSETPLSCLALFEGGPCLIADANFDVLMVKLKSHFQNAKGHKVECRGSRYRYCDFLIKVGTVTMSSSARGISVEVRTRALILQVRVEILRLHCVTVLTLDVSHQVEYCPCVVPGDCWSLMKEFMQSFLGPSVPDLPSVFAAKPEGQFTAADCVDTMTQYLELFNKLRKLQIAGSNVR